MLRIAVLAAALTVLIGIKSADAKPEVTCSSGTTAFLDGKLRIFGTYYETRDEWGFDEFACLRGAKRPVSAGLEGSTTGTGSADTPAYAFDGSRYLLSYFYTDGEGGPSAHMSVQDLVTRRSFGFGNVACCEGVPAFRVASDGSYVALTPGEDLFVKRPGHGFRTLSTRGAIPKDLAMFGGTVYWSEAGVAHSALLAGVTGGEATMLEPVRFERGKHCGGRPVAASGRVRVFVHDGVRLGCRVDRGVVFGAGAKADPLPRIVGDRWVLLRPRGTAWVIDSRTGRAVTVAGGVAQATVLVDGTLAWTDTAGRVLAQSPDSSPVVLAPGGASALAAARRAVYWTESGTPKVYRPSAARSASNPG
jgi:hypothetical protein